jgi:hypothetical protein
MDNIQRINVKRLTPNMWSALEYAAKHDGGVEVGGASWMRSINILARRGFCTVQRVGNGWHLMKLTEAGREALALAPMTFR